MKEKDTGVPAGSDTVGRGTSSERGIHFFPFLRPLILLNSIFGSAWRNRRLYAVMRRKTISVLGKGARFQSKWFAENEKNPCKNLSGMIY